MTHRNSRFMHPWGWVSLLFVCAFSWMSCQSEKARDALWDLGGKPEAAAALHEPDFLRHAIDAPPLRTTAVTLVAVHGQSHVAEIPYALSPDLFVRLELGPASLLRHPDGTPFNDGDQVSISISAEVDPSGSPGRLIATLSPSGLEFNPSDPAKLMLSFAHADPDVDGDGHDDLTSNPGRVTMWRQPTTGSWWEPVSGATHVGEWQVEAELSSFSRYALAF